MRIKRVSNEARNLYEYKCDGCGDEFEADRRAAEKRRIRFEKDLCPCCLKKLHNEASKYGDFKDLVSGQVELRCGACGTLWVTSRDSATTGLRQSNNIILCRDCKQDRKLWAELVQVQCFLCEAPYGISEATLKMRPHLEQRICASCSQKGRVVTEDQKQKIREKNTGYRHTQEDIEKIRERSKQDDIKGHLRQYAKERREGLRPGPVTGLTQSVEWVENRAAKLRGQKRTEEFKDRMREHRNAYIERNGGVSPETCVKLSKIQIELRMNGFNPASGHRQETYHPLKPQPAFLKPRKRPYVLSSSWESFYARWLDSQAEVVSWTYEAMSIDLPDGKTYLTDFIWEDVDGQVYVIEVKPRRKVERNVDGAQVKLEALTDFCALMTEQTDRLWVGMLVDEGSLEAIGFTL